MNKKIGIDTPIDVTRVIDVYSGKIDRCCCGCAGKYSYHPDHTEAGSKERGYEVTQDEVNLRQVNRVVNLLNRNAEKVEVINESIFSLEQGKRLYIVYYLGVK